MKTTKKAKIIFTMLSMMVVFAIFVPVAFADGDPVQVVNNLSNVMFSLVRAVGIIILLWGVVQVGMSIQSHDPSQRSNGFLILAGGVIITFAKEILDMIVG